MKCIAAVRPYSYYLRNVFIVYQLILKTHNIKYSLKLISHNNSLDFYATSQLLLYV